MKLIKFGLLLLVLILMTAIVWNSVENRQFNRYVKSQNGKEMNVDVNTAAPVIAKSEIEIKAPLEKAWQVLTRIDQWPSWQKDVTEAVVEGKVAEDAVFDWKAGGLSFHSRIHTMHPMKEFGWTGKTFGASAIHNWWFEERDGVTVVRVEESLQGVFPSLFKSYFQKNLDSGVIRNLTELKAAAEK